MSSWSGTKAGQVQFRVGAKDAPLLAKQLGGIDSSDLVNLPNYRNFTRLMIRGTTSKPFSSTTLTIPLI